MCVGVCGCVCVCVCVHTCHDFVDVELVHHFQQVRQVVCDDGDFDDDKGHNDDMGGCERGCVKEIRQIVWMTMMKEHGRCGVGHNDDVRG